MKGRYQLKIREDLPSPIKISQFANEPIAFHLHKKGDIFKKFDGANPPSIQESINLRKEVEKIKEKIKREKLHDEMKKLAKSVVMIEDESVYENEVPKWKKMLKEIKSNRIQSRNREVTSTISQDISTGKLPLLKSRVDLSQSYPEGHLPGLKQKDTIRIGRKNKPNLRIERTDLSVDNFNSNILIQSVESDERNKTIDQINIPEIKASAADFQDQQFTLIRDQSKRQNKNLESKVMMTLFDRSRGSSMQRSPVIDKGEKKFNYDLNQSRNTNSSKSLHQGNDQIKKYQTIDSNPRSSIQSSFKKLILQRFGTNIEQPSEWELQKQKIRSSLLKLQKSCQETCDDTQKNLDKIDKGLSKESLIKENMEFTVSTLQEFDNIEPKGLDIIFEYKVGDKNFQQDEAKKAVKDYRYRNFESKNKIIQRLEFEASSKQRKLAKKIKI
ncbi:UNKNOWN [Stylonychia lemnae]|uniref:Uncharacterized protein n=1 Tax=Stylonychia lemnae TaxID=5949 RepID=A0A078B9T8_STYLE|nr:UNKNOWN [Stylonychia lemnae]|eukprot:CDW90318.1 UNKNOWN [Stylonychia lemnae]